MNAAIRPAAGPLIGYTAGVVLALYPNMLPRSVLVQLLVVAVFGVFGALLGGLVAARLGCGAASGAVCRVSAQVTAVSLAVWLLWQGVVRDGAAFASVSPLDFGLLAAGVIGAPYLVALLNSVRTRARTAVLAAVVGVAAVLVPVATADAAAQQSYAERFTGIDSPAPGIRVYGSLSDGASPPARADDAVARLVAAGGLRKRAVVIAVPTGSGWVDPHFVRGVEKTLRGDSAIVVAQYTEQPSWQSFLFHRDAAAESTVAVVEALHRRAPSTPVYLYGQSLGTVGVVAAHRRAIELGQPVAATLQSGTPADVPLDGPAQLNSSDPVGVWSLRLLFAPPDRGATEPGRATRRPPWLPVVGFLQATIDLLGATAPPPGLGHRYDEHQGSDLVRGAGLPKSA
ncbi:Alpha/beta-hydrolase catalytic domain-containing protein OS=Tsukamurella paurometabola (strain ATCC 8368 / DSM / CCUG 35730 / CIP 100753 / JCM 10117 / KCTC 9821 / NBRC 16120 / NCIMB 702349 / NCTC 13040) OX=521096 GN=Tpau_2875 PE=4 SV=1 [Tsukamurella paurometabola]|uniref:Alpha/beta-hydrolase catalytic domain-containing protein n=1 Tax=Tsukamurella paurometabola (strain ATCC 8368 / DSM 20162 / CCUG 35730 / CIP 100753 / JCM 10117 / KCTC 9821 / NBRC 16120 / NCIMB 702349 / NCTC 13040) TaxID=521096 RepID=D5UTI8_TSUPD|nr:alpha/beta-hydrolase family protein [Tsukamurella paurometabola]ADG79473.1 conserved hypothetical protein [Tsukamurella paurometabola DSM 20162]SUP35896.1 Predicted membrane protein [Tsukamurella paurometabola]